MTLWDEGDPFAVNWDEWTAAQNKQGNEEDVTQTPSWGWRDVDGVQRWVPLDERGNALLTGVPAKGTPGYFEGFSYGAPRTTRTLAPQVTPGGMYEGAWGGRRLPNTQEENWLWRTAGITPPPGPGQAGYQSPTEVAQQEEARQALTQFLEGVWKPVQVDVPQLKGGEAFGTPQEVVDWLRGSGYQPVVSRAAGTSNEPMQVITVAAKDPTTGEWGNFKDIWLTTSSFSDPNAPNPTAWDEPWGRNIVVANVSPAFSGMERSQVESVWPTEQRPSGQQPVRVSTTQTPEGYGSEGSPPVMDLSLPNFTPQTWIAKGPREQAKIKARIEATGANFDQWLKDQYVPWVTPTNLRVARYR